MSLTRTVSVGPHRLASLRRLLVEKKCSCVIINHRDSHDSEYLCPYFDRISFLSGFTGSNGVCMVSVSEALLWTDGRYFLQATKELFPEWKLMRLAIDQTLSDYLGNHHSTNDSRVLVHSATTTVREVSAWIKKGINIEITDDDPLNSIWEDRPHIKNNPIQIHPVEYAGESTSSKLKRIIDHLQKNKTLRLIVTALDCIAWLLNLRGSDIMYSPLFFSYLIVNVEGPHHLFVSVNLVNDIKSSITDDNVEMHPYEDIFEYLRKANFLKEFKIPSVFKVASIDPVVCNVGIIKSLLGESVGDWDRCLEDYLLLEPCAIIPMMAVKNSTEIEGARKAHVIDGLAKTRFIYWLMNSASLGSVTEIDAVNKLNEFRMSNPLCKGCSFSTISASGPNSAVIHYHPEMDTARVISRRDLYLVDSGGQYEFGTTDVTRCFVPNNHSIGELEAEMSDLRLMRDWFTRVLKGNIALSRQVFPPKTTGHALDSLARQYLWMEGADFRHGTGHGVGAYLCVHEGPHSISPARGGQMAPLVPGMLVSNEPGYYRDNEWGIRIENIMLVKQYSDVKNEAGDSSMMCFETLTLIPLDKRLINMDMMSPSDIQWLNEYHHKVYESHRSYILDESEQSWFKTACSPL